MRSGKHKGVGHRTNKLLHAMQIRDERIRQQNIAEDRAIAAEDVVPVIYASFAIALKEKWGFGEKRMNRLFTQTQQIWMDFTDAGYTHEQILEDCLKRTGIQLMNPRQAEKEGYFDESDNIE